MFLSYWQEHKTTRFLSLTMLTERNVIIIITYWTVSIINKDITCKITTVKFTGIGTDTGCNRYRYRYHGIGSDTDTSDTDNNSLISQILSSATPGSTGSLQILSNEMLEMWWSLKTLEMKMKMMTMRKLLLLLDFKNK